MSLEIDTNKDPFTKGLRAYQEVFNNLVTKDLIDIVAYINSIIASLNRVSFDVTGDNTTTVFDFDYTGSINDPCPDFRLKDAVTGQNVPIFDCKPLSNTSCRLTIEPASLIGEDYKLFVLGNP